ncbi:hypothetical protein GGS26DRAFT_3130 [Hypomontagnella submonticulosa]|nr:hypothetical protein GGS26DRAFT_3130 [Hypomontagnella submonticulosa]
MAGRLSLFLISKFFGHSYACTVAHCLSSVYGFSAYCMEGSFCCSPAHNLFLVVMLRPRSPCTCPHCSSALNTPRAPLFLTRNAKRSKVSEMGERTNRFVALVDIHRLLGTLSGAPPLTF